MGSERIPCGLPQDQASGYEKKYFLTLDSLWLATGNINLLHSFPCPSGGEVTVLVAK